MLYKVLVEGGFFQKLARKVVGNFVVNTSFFEIIKIPKKLK
jgi:hypothetical protein